MATKSKKSQDKYKPDQFVVHPHHGAAKVVRKVNKNVDEKIDQLKADIIGHFFDETLDEKALKRFFQSVNKKISEI